MNVPYRLLYTNFQAALGGLRENFFKKNIAVEIGGKGKGREQFKGFTPDKKIIAVDTDTTDGIRRPLFIFGFLETQSPTGIIPVEVRPHG